MSEQPLLDIEALRKIDAKPGDVFVLELPEDFRQPDPEEVAHMEAQLLAALRRNDARLLVPPPGAKLRSFRIDNATQRQLSVSVRVDEGMFFVVRVEESSTANPSAVVSFQDSPDADLATAEAIDRLRAKFLEGYAGAVCVPSLKEASVASAAGDSDVAALAEAADEPMVIDRKDGTR